MRSVAMAGRFTPPADDLAAQDWQAVAEHLVLTSGPAETTHARDQFDTLMAAYGLTRIASASE
ncbi:hypothetical protein [Leisingera aquaemixtae]|uniref:hypothetical protein n=1 Tax=Leisingera aquaemixtae TaxID=1396826 RepID=UPI0011AE88AC|nr:hypothetical protein [Leisingera aquaemixtae]